MTDEPGQQRGSGRSNRPLQPRPGSSEGDSTGGLLQELASVEDRRSVERVERLLADAELISRLQLSDFDTGSSDWKELASALAEYGYGVFVGWGRSGVLKRMARNHGGRGVYGYTKLPDGLNLHGDDALNSPPS